MASKIMIKKFSRFMLVGVISTIINFSIFSLLHLLGYQIFNASLIGYFAGVINSYYWGSKWVHFQVFKIEIWSFIKFLTLYGLNGLIVGLIIQEVQLLYGFDYKTCWVIGTTYGMLANFIGQKLIIFKNY